MKKLIKLIFKKLFQKLKKFVHGKKKLLKKKIKLEIY